MGLLLNEINSLTAALVSDEVPNPGPIPIASNLTTSSSTFVIIDEFVSVKTIASATEVCSIS